MKSISFWVDFHVLTNMHVVRKLTQELHLPLFDSGQLGRLQVTQIIVCVLQLARVHRERGETSGRIATSKY